MTAKRHPCYLCGIVGWESEVRMTVLEVPEHDRELQDIGLPINESQRGVGGFDYRKVPGRFIAETICRDTAACKERAATAELEELGRVLVPVKEEPQPEVEPESPGPPSTPPPAPPITVPPPDPVEEVAYQL